MPPTLTGMAGQSGGFTNNFISLKTLVERLQYGRELLIKFWQQEIELVRRAMGFRRPAYIHFDQMSLADDATEKNLLLQLADRDIISHETILERFKEIPSVEKIRLKREFKDRDKEDAPNKAGPYHNPQKEHELEKIGLQSGKVTPQDVGLETSVPDDILMPKPEPKAPIGGPPSEKKKKKEDKNGRPKFSTDTKPRKQREEKPKSKPGLADLIVWSQESFDSISSVVTDAFLKMNNKKNLRQITKSESFDLERIKLDVLTSIEPMQDVNEQLIVNTLSSGKRCSAEFIDKLLDEGVDITSMSISAYRKKAVSSYVEFLCK